jgi:hypothetical protein
VISKDSDLKSNKTISNFLINGFYNSGLNNLGKCIILSSNSTISTSTIPLMNTFYDTPIKFDVNFIYSCNEKYTLAQFKENCILNKWKDFLIFKYFDKMDLIGKFGSSDYKYSYVNK